MRTVCPPTQVRARVAAEWNKVCILQMLVVGPQDKAFVDTVLLIRQMERDGIFPAHTCPVE